MIYMTTQGVIHGNLETGFSIRNFRASNLKRIHLSGGFIDEW